MAELAFQYDDNALYAAVARIDQSVDHALTAIINYHAPKVEASAKRGAKWTDRTSNARNGLFAVAERDRPSYRIVLGHGVSYGIWLEVRFSGRYATIVPTINDEGPQVMKTVAGLFGMLR